MGESLGGVRNGGGRMGNHASASNGLGDLEQGVAERGQERISESEGLT